MYEQNARYILANNIRLYRVKNNLSQEELSEKLDTTASFVSQIENSKKNLQIDYIGRIADAMEVPLKELFSERN